MRTLSDAGQAVLGRSHSERRGIEQTSAVCILSDAGSSSPRSFAFSVTRDEQSSAVCILSDAGRAVIGRLHSERCTTLDRLEMQTAEDCSSRVAQNANGRGLLVPRRSECERPRTACPASLRMRTAEVCSSRVAQNADGRGLLDPASLNY